MKKVVLFLMAVCSLGAVADTPVYDSGWQFNHNVTIEKVFARSSGIVAKLSNGSYCWITADEKVILTTLLSMRSQGSAGTIVCEKAVTGKEEGQDTRRLNLVVF